MPTSSSTKRSGTAWTITGITLSIVGIALNTLGITPDQWNRSLRSWARIAHGLGAAPMLAIAEAIVILGLLAYIVVSRELRRRAAPRIADTPTPTLSSIPGPTVFTNAEQLHEVFTEVAGRPGEHTVRILVATGASVFKVLKWYVETQESQHLFHIRVMMMNPDSKLTPKAGRSWPKESRQLHQNLRELADYTQKAHKRVDLRWRTYDCPPSIRAVMFDETHLFLGFMEWEMEGGSMELHDPGSAYMYIDHEQENAGYFINFFKTWFDHDWKLGASRYSSEGR
jgi:hypothetical protein